MTERIYVHVEDAELRELSSRLDTSMARMKKISVDSFKLDSRTKAILARLPGLREANALWREIEATSMVAAGAGGAAGALATGSAALMILMLMVQIARRLEMLERAKIRESAEYEDMLREGLELSHKEFMEIPPEERGFVSAQEQMEFILASEGFWAAVRWRVKAEVLALTSAWAVGPPMVSTAGVGPLGQRGWDLVSMEMELTDDIE